MAWEQPLVDDGGGAQFSNIMLETADLVSPGEVGFDRVLHAAELHLLALDEHALVGVDGQSAVFAFLLLALGRGQRVQVVPAGLVVVVILALVVGGARPVRRVILARHRQKNPAQFTQLLLRVTG